MRISYIAALLSVVVAGSCAATSDADRSADNVCTLAATGASTGRRVDICDFLVARYGTLLTGEVMAGSLHLTDGAGFEIKTVAPANWQVAWSRRELFPPNDNGLADQRSIVVFWHEVGHMWLGPLMEGGRRISIGDRYGTEAPDWLDEAWAVWAEPAADRTGRIRRVPADTLPSLRQLTELGHPRFNTEERTTLHGADEIPVSRLRAIESPCKGTCTWVPDSARGMYTISEIRRYADGRVDTSVTLSPTRPDTTTQASFEKVYFYPLSYSLLRYIRETGGEAAVRELIARYRVDPTPRAQALENLPGLPASLDALEVGWHAFLAERRTEPK